jgi:hypothetical protein
MRQVFNKIETNYNFNQCNNTLIALSNWIKYLESHEIDKVDKHLIKDLRRNQDRLCVLIKKL